MIRWLYLLLQRVLGRSDIVHNGSLYMSRWRFFNAPRWLGGWGLRVHRIVRSDMDRELHDHPFSFLSIILWGGYWELSHAPKCPSSIGHHEACRLEERYRVGSFVFRRAEHAHRLVLSRPAWTFVIRGPIRKRWGFYTAEGWLPWREWAARRNHTIEDAR